MKYYVFHLAFLLVLFLLQASGLRVLPDLRFLVPQFVLLFVVLIALRKSVPQVVWFSFIGGFLLELISGLFFGGLIVSLMLTGLLIYFVSRNLAQLATSIWMAALYTGLATLLTPFWVFIYQILIALFDISPAVPLRNLYSINIIWTIVLNLVFFYLLRRAMRYLPHEEKTL